MTLLSLIQSSTDTKELLHFYLGFNKVATLSLSEIDHQSDSVAKNILTLFPEQEHVIISLPNCAEFVSIFFGILKAGKVPVPVTTAEYVSKDYMDDLKRHLAVLFYGAPWIDESNTGHVLQDVGIEAPELNLRSRPQKIALVQLSSGSTDFPKAVMLSHQNILANMSQIKEGMKVTEFDVLSSWLPFYHDMGLIGGLLSAIYNRVEAHFMTPTDFLANPLRWIQNVSETSATIIMGPNLLYKHLASRVSEDDVVDLDLSNIRLSLCGSEPVNAKILENMAQKFLISGFDRKSFFPVYGMAENTLAVSFPKIGVGLFEHNHMGHSLVSCGKPLRDVQIRIVCESGRLALPEEIGEIQIQSPSMTQGYYKNKVATDQLFDNKWMKTGDLGMVKEGELFICGRKKEVIILNGKNYFPGDIEAQIANLRLHKIGRAAVFQPQNQNEYWVIAECKSWNPRVREILKLQISQRLHAYLWQKPSHVILAAPCSLPRTSSGKIKRTFLQNPKNASIYLAAEKKWRHRLLEAKKELLGQTMKYLWKAKVISRFVKRDKLVPSPAADPIREIVRLAFAEVLHIDKAKVDFEKGFFEYSLESIQIVQLNLKIESEIRKNVRDEKLMIQLVDFIQLKNLNELTKHIHLLCEKENSKNVEGKPHDHLRSEISATL